MQQIEKGIYIEQSQPGITVGAMILTFGSVLVDAPLHPEDGRSWSAMLRNLGSSVGRLLVNLDSHFDRTIGARALECPLMTHLQTAKTINNRPAIFKGQNADSGSEWELLDGLTGIRWVRPTLTYTEHCKLDWGEYPVLIEHHPGPDAGSTWVVIPESNVIFVGDTVLANQPPFLENADIPKWIEALNILLTPEYKKYLVISSRGGIVDRPVIREQRRYMKEILKRLEKLSAREAEPERTETMVSSLISRLEFPVEFQQYYTQRLRFGLYHYYSKHYQSPSSNGES